MNYMILFWALFGLTLLFLLVNMLGMPIIRKKQAQKAEKEQEKRISEIKKGDKIMLVSGVFGYVLKIHKRTFEIEVNEGIVLRVDQQGIMGYFPEEDKKKKRKY